MGLFKKKGDIIDLVNLQKKGILKRSDDPLTQEKSNNLDLIDLTNQRKSNHINKDPSTSNFLSAFANIGSSQNKENNNKNLELQNLKVKIEDIEYKLERFIERLEKIEDKFS